MTPFVGSDAPGLVARPQRTRGDCKLEVAAKGNRNVLARLYQEGAYKARLPTKAPGDALEAVLINTSGGLTGGDRMELKVRIGDGAQAVITTQACEKFYKSTGAPAVVTSQIELGRGGVLHWLPQEAILFDHANVARDLSINLAPDARLVALEAVLLGRKWKDERFEQGLFADRWQICVEGKRVHTEQVRLMPHGPGTLGGPAKLGAHAAYATLLLVGGSPSDLLVPIRGCLAGIEEVVSGASAWTVGGTEKLIVRFLAADGYELRKALVPVIAMLGEGVILPKMWTT